MSDWNDEYKRRLRDFLADKGKPVRFEEPRYSGDQPVSTYGWTYYAAQEHCSSWGGKCVWVIAPGAEVTEETYSMFTDTFSDNENEMGLNVSPAQCACGMYKDVTLRWMGSFDDALRAVSGEGLSKPKLTL